MKNLPDFSDLISPGRWAIVLAGGDGERLRPFIRQRLGQERPKQYCALTGRKTLLEETLERVGALAPSRKTITVIASHHRPYLDGRAAPPGRLIEQPCKRETAPGIFLPAAHILREDPSATVLIFPSDHFISPEPRFARCVAEAAALAERWRDRIVLLGAEADAPEPDYGWIEPDWSWSTASGAMQVARFMEKPRPSEAELLFKQGCLWNTMVMAVKARALWDIGRACLPGMMAEFDALLPLLGTPWEAEAVGEAYGRLGSFNFSRDVVERVPRRVMVQPMYGIEWSDLGRPARITQLLERLGGGPGRLASAPA